MTLPELGERRAFAQTRHSDAELAKYIDDPIVGGLAREELASNARFASRQAQEHAESVAAQAAEHARRHAHKPVTQTAQPDLEAALGRCSKAALIDALLSAASLQTECCDEDGDALVQAVAGLVRPVLVLRGDVVPTLFREKQ